ncbi:MAG: ATP-binding protein [Candidatus Omnitrophota bacterium]
MAQEEKKPDPAQVHQQGSPHGNQERLGKIRQEFAYTIDIQRVVTAVLRLSLETQTLDELLDRTLDLILSLPELSFEKRGYIFLVEEGRPDMLELKAQRGISEEARRQCLRIGFGDCVCGMKPDDKDIFFVQCRDNRRCVPGEAGELHGHYCIPIFFKDELQGVINIVVSKEHRDSSEERNFLKAISDTLGGVIKRKQAESKLFEDRLMLEREVKQRSQNLLDVNQNLLLEVQQHQRSRQALLRAQKDLQETLVNLREANKKLEQTSRRKTEFISFVAHELRTPLTAIRNASSILIKKYRAHPESDRSTKQMLDIIVNNVDRQMKTLLDLLDISRIESGAFLLHKDNINIVPLVKEVFDFFSSQAGQKGIRCALRSEESEVIALADASHLRRVLNNLISNAIKFTPHGGRVEVSVEKKENEVLVRVSDTGVGIRENDLGRIFQKFYRGEVRENSVEGIGLGLSIAKGIIEMHGGSISVDSKPDQGSVFSFTIPVGKPGERKTILIIEDERDIAQTLTEVFRGEGFVAFIAEDGKAGLQKARKERPDAITLNLRLPELSGEEVCRELKKDPQTECIPIVMLTAKDSEADRVIGRVIGADYYFSKPSDPYEIVEKVKSLIGEKRCP